MLNYLAIVSRHSPENGCFADDGEILIVAPINSWPKKATDHYFVGAESGRVNRFGWISAISAYAPYTRDLVYEEKINYAVNSGLRRLKLGDPVALDFVRRGIPPTIELLLHKVLFCVPK